METKSWIQTTRFVWIIDLAFVFVMKIRFGFFVNRNSFYINSWNLLSKYQSVPFPRQSSTRLKENIVLQKTVVTVVLCRQSFHSWYVFSSFALLIYHLYNVERMHEFYKIPTISAVFINNISVISRNHNK